MVRYLVIPVTPYRQNCSLLICEHTGKAALIDPGGEAELLLEQISVEGVELESILLTHGHLDHVGAAGIISAETSVPIIGPHIDDQFWFDSLRDQSEWLGFPPIDLFLPNHWLHDGELLKVGDIDLQVLHCPGHTPGHVVFFCAAINLAIVGDVLFKGSIGRTDLPRGDHQALLNSIKQKLWPLGNEVKFIPGHGGMSSFGAEMRSNPFVGSSVLQPGV